ncbi:exonuclease SbcCD subunit D [Sinomonas sp. P47F7]|uniref:exonuclease SbcCD subunit D n=1 Tax=Sinomonas sp. P47F7 TaxID=3410987 RepID=UPI003BF57AC0
MRILHTSDWHIGRTFHKLSTLSAFESVFKALESIVREKKVDVVAAAGDIFDSSTPSADAVRLLDSILLRLSDAGARVVLTSGNHDSPARLGAKAPFAHKAGIHVLTETDGLAAPITIPDEHGDVAFYGIPFIEPALQRHVWTDADVMKSQKDALGYALKLVRSDFAERGGRSIVLAHTFVQGADGESCDSERDIVGGIDKVPVDYFTDFTYAALGHIHGRAKLADSVRYSGAPLHYSFSEAGKARGGWLVDLDANGLAGVEWVDLPVPRPLSVITGTLEELLVDDAYAAIESNWISATITDPVRPVNTLRRLQERFKHAVEITFAPSYIHNDGGASYAEKVAGKTDFELVDVFLETVRNGEGVTNEEADVMREVIGDGSLV